MNKIVRTQPPSRSLVSIDDAAACLACHRATIRRYIAAGRLTGYRVGPRAIRVDLSQVEAIARPMPTAGSDRHAVA